MANLVAKNAGDDPGTIHFSILGNGAANTLLANTGNAGTFIPRKLFIQNNGNLHMLDDSNTWVTYTVTAGMMIPFRPVRIGAGTTCNVVAWG